MTEFAGAEELQIPESDASLPFLASLSDQRWPEPLDEAAYHGLAGHFVRTVEPHSEADPAALLVQFLVAAGSVIGRVPHVVREADRHGCNLFAAIVGESSKGRKGTSLGYAMRAVRTADDTWSSASGLNSGEGVIWSVRDPIEKEEPVRDKAKKITSYQTVMIDQGVADKRLFVVEGELASALRVMGREGNTLSAVLRNAWDSGALRSLTKNSPAQSTDAHVSIVGHISRQELRRHLEDTEAANGFGNRILWVCARRSKQLPFGGSVASDALDGITRQLRAIVERAQSMARLDLDASARALWVRVYPDLSEGHPGLFGAVTGRAEAQVTRLALLYAVLDGQQAIREAHLRAALEVWRYCEDSARHIFGDALGDDLADQIQARLQATPDGLTRSDIRALAGSHVRASRIEGALRTLAELGRARCVREPSKGTHGQGRDIERWFAYRRAGEGREESEESSPPTTRPTLSSLSSLPSQPEHRANGHVNGAESHDASAEPDWFAGEQADLAAAERDQPAEVAEL